MSLLQTPLPSPLATLARPTMFFVPAKGFAPACVRSLYERLPVPTKRLHEVDDGVFWMCAHPVEAAGVLADWFAETLL